MIFIKTLIVLKNSINFRLMADFSPWDGSGRAIYSSHSEWNAAG